MYIYRDLESLLTKKLVFLILKLFAKQITFILNAINICRITYSTVRYSYPNLCHFLESVYLVAYIIALYANNFYYYSIFGVLTVSIIIIFYIFYIDVGFNIKHPIIYNLLFIICSIAILSSVFILYKLLIYEILKLINNILKMGPNAGGSENQHAGNSPNRDPSDGGPSGGDPSGGDPSGGDPSGGGPSGGGPFGGGPSGGGPSGETIETEEERKKRRKREIRAKYNNSEKGKKANNKWKTENAEKVKESKRKYNKSDKGINTIDTWEIDNHDKVKANRNKYANSERGKQVKHDYYENNKEYIKDVQSNWREENAEKKRKADATYYEENAERIKKRVNDRYIENKEEINSKRRKDTSGDPFDDILGEYTSYRGKK